MKKKSKILTVLFTLICILVVLVIGAVKFASREEFNNTTVICDGASIDGVNVGGMTKEEAAKAVEEHTDKLMNRKVIIDINGQQLLTDFGEVGFKVKENDYIDKLFNIGKNGNIISRIVELSTVKDSELKYELSYYVDEELTKQFVENSCLKYNAKAKNSHLKYKNGKFKATNDRVGVKVQVEETVSAIIAGIDGNTKDEGVFVDAVVKTKQPKYSKEMISKCKDLLGTFSTYYGSSTASRANNIKIATNYINGTIIYPGETFSTISVIKDRTEANGYQPAAEYSSGKVVTGIGGGVCQVSTTLYNAVINAELKVTERSPHSMVVSYVPLSRDAAIAGTSKDLKFKNNTNAPIYIWGSAEGGYLTFKVYGEETRSKKRKIEFQSETVQTIQPGDSVVTVDSSKPASYRVVTQSARTGYSTKLWKIIYVNGVQKKKVLVNTSYYSASPQYVTIGVQSTPTPVPTPAETPDNATSTEPAETQSPQKTEEPVETQTPKPTETPAATDGSDTTATE